MAAPRYINAGTGVTDAGGAWTYTCQAATAAGYVFIVQILQDGNTNAQVTVSGGTNIEDLAGTDNAWTLIPGPNADSSFPVGAGPSARQFLYIGRSLSTVAPTISGGNVGSEDLYIQSYQFNDVSTGTTLAEVIENATAGSVANGTGTGTTVSDTAVTTLGVDRLALNFVGVDDDLLPGAMSGETGGNWGPLGTFSSATGTDGAVTGYWSLIEWDQVDLLDQVGSANIFGDATRERIGQSFTAPLTHSAWRVGAFLSWANTPTDDVVVQIMGDSAGEPDEVVIGQGTIDMADGTKGIYSVSISAALTASTTYWIIFTRSGALDASNRYQVDVSGSSVIAGTYSGYAGGVWTDLGIDVRYGLSSLDGIGTVDGGTATITSAGWGVAGFALIGNTPAAPVVYQPRHGFVNHQNPGLL